MNNQSRQKWWEISLYFLVFVFLSSVVAILNRHHMEQQTNFYSAYVSMAEYYSGQGQRTILTYPLWGYPFVLMMLPKYSMVVVPQVVLGALAQTFLFFRLKKSPGMTPAIVIMFIGAGPWYLLHSVKWPQSFAASFLVLGIALLDVACNRRSILIGLVAGASFGTALYFRSEFLLLPLFLAGEFAVINRWKPFLKSDLRPAAAGAAMAMLLLVPWTVHYYKATEHVSLTASQKGIVSFISLGQLPNNPWGATYRDEAAVEFLKRRGIDLPPQSDSADRILYREFRHRVRTHPVAYLEKVTWNGVVTLASGFYSGEPHLSQTDEPQYEMIRHVLKVGVLHGDVGKLSATVGNARLAPALAALYWMGAKLAGAVFVTVAMIGILAWVRTGPYSSILILLWGYVVYQTGLLLALATEPRYLNGLYLALVPFFALVVRKVPLVHGKRRDTP